MLFNSFEFLLVFLPLTLIVFTIAVRLGGNTRILQLLLFGASCVFIGASGPLSLFLLLFSLGMNYGLLRWLSSTQAPAVRRLILILSVAANLSLIGGFKYADFLGQTVGVLAGLDIPRFNVELPLAVSFYTFQLIALNVDSWRYQWECPPLAKFALFITFFPQLIAGPIVRFEEVREDLRSLGPVVLSNLALGCAIFFVGLFKKAVIADSLAPAANLFFSGVEAGASPGLLEAWGGTFTYTFQIYFDFSGYSDMAIGLAAMFGIHLPANFYSPYRAESIIDFWRRWHMTLSRFLRDYLYIPLGGSRQGLFSRWRNVFVTMLLGGLWHGASWNFVLWGGMHGALIAVNHMARRLGLGLPPLLGWGVTFLIVTCTWVVFRSQDISAALRIYAGMAGLNGIILPERLQGPLAGLAGAFPFIEFASSELFRAPTAILIAIAGFAAFLMPNSEQLFRERPAAEVFTVPRAITIGAVAALGLFGINQATEFVYFRF